MGVTMATRQSADELAGRRWAVDRIAEWLGSGAGTLVLSGGPGSGKTALVTALAGGQRLPVGRFHAVHLCRGHVLASTDPIRVLAGIAHRLARSVPGYATSLRRLG